MKTITSNRKLLAAQNMIRIITEQQRNNKHFFKT